MSTILARVIGGGSSAGTATARDVLAGKTFSNDDDVEIVGTATEVPATEHHVTTEDQVIIPSYSHTTGNQTLKGVSIENISASNIKSGVTAKVNNGESDIVSVAGSYTSNLSEGQTAMTAAQLLAGYSGYVNGSGEIQGSMVNKGGATSTATVSRSGTDILMRIPADGYYNTSSYLKAAGSVFGDAAQTHVLSGKYFTSSNGLKIQGSISSQAAKTVYATTSDQTAVSAGKYCSGAITVKKLTQTNLAAANILRGKTISINNGSTNVWSVTGNSAVMKMVSGSYIPTWSTANSNNINAYVKDDKGLTYSRIWGTDNYCYVAFDKKALNITPLYGLTFYNEEKTSYRHLLINYTNRNIVFIEGPIFRGTLPSSLISTNPSSVTLVANRLISKEFVYYVMGY